MKKNAKASVVAIVGRANVGKSSLFNALLGRRETIVAREPGTTRDSIMAKASYFDTRPSHLDAVPGHSTLRDEPLGSDSKRSMEERATDAADTAMRQEPAASAPTSRRGQGKAVRGVWKDFWLVDTAGMKAPEDEFELSIQEQIKETSQAADVILLVVEADVPPVEEDRRLARLALKSKKPVILVVNKIDKNSHANLTDWQRLGIKEIVATSTTQKIGLDALLEKLANNLVPASIKPSANKVSVAILGRPNVGKSSLFNSLAAKQQALISPQAGTTRDVNRLSVRFHGWEIELADTAGIRRSGKIERGVEKFSVLRTIAAIEQSDICLLLMDVNELNVQLDQKIAGMVKTAGRGLVLVVSKWDTLESKDERERIASQIASHYDFVPWAPLVFTSALSGQNITKIFELILEIADNRRIKIKTPELNHWLSAVSAQHPPPPTPWSGPRLKRRGRQDKIYPKLRYIVQEDDIDMPSFKIFGSDVKALHFSYRRYLEKQFREIRPLIGTPIKFWFIDKRAKNNKQ